MYYLINDNSYLYRHFEGEKTRDNILELLSKFQPNRFKKAIATKVDKEEGLSYERNIEEIHERKERERRQKEGKL